MPRNPDKARCTYPGCNAWARPGTDRCSAHSELPDLPCDDDQISAAMLQALLQDPPDGLQPIEKELHYLMALRRCLDQAALKRVSSGQPFDLAAHAALQCQVSNRILRAVSISDPSAARPRELTDLVDQVYNDMADDFPALRPPK